MSNPPHGPDALRLRIEMAECDLRAADSIHLLTASGASLITAVAKLKGALADMIQLHYERGIPEHSGQQDHGIPT